MSCVGCRATPSAAGITDDLPIRWHLNEGLRPARRHPGAMRAEIEREGLCASRCSTRSTTFCPLPSTQGAGSGRHLRPGSKADVSPDRLRRLHHRLHSPWPTRATAARRAATGRCSRPRPCGGRSTSRRRATPPSGLQSHGNNGPGLPRILATWDEEALELRIFDVPEHGVSPTRSTTSCAGTPAR